jgi:choline dehydrogenase-like flavoprotein
MDSYDAIVIGTGTAAQVTAARLRRAGRSVGRERKRGAFQFSRGILIRIPKLIAA